jgi:hypothetical protein
VQAIRPVQRGLTASSDTVASGASRRGASAYDAQCTEWLSARRESTHQRPGEAHWPSLRTRPGGEFPEREGIAYVLAVARDHLVATRRGRAGRTSWPRPGPGTGSAAGTTPRAAAGTTLSRSRPGRPATPP